MRVLCVDPGGTTGWVRWEGGPDWQTGGTEPGRLLDFGEEADRFRLYVKVRSWTPDIIVCENFIPRAGALTFQPEALRIIGYLEGWASAAGCGFVLQFPAQAKSFGTAAKLKAVGWWPKGLGHAQDAARHLLVYICTNDEGRKLDGDRTNRLLAEVL